LEQIFEHPYFIVVTILAELYENKVASEEILQWKQILSSMLKSMIRIDGNIEVFHDFEGNIVTVLNFRDQASMEQYEGFEFKDIINLAKEHIGFSISVGISDYCYDPCNIRDAYYQTIYALSSKYTNHQAKVYEYRNLSLNQTNEFYSWNLIDEINKCLDVLDYNKIEKLMLQELNRIREYENIEFASMIYMSLLSVLFSYFVKQGRNIDDIFGKGFHPNTILNNETSYLAKRSFVCDCYQRAISYQLEHQDTKAHQIAKQAKSYIEKHFSDPELQIADISKELLVNQTYLRKMFKDEYQMTISDYITKYRMEKAKEMIKKENSKLSYISYEVGYNDTSYFSKCFKKYFGYLPSDIINKQ
jgi:two-component system response regulator YesN